VIGGSGQVRIEDQWLGLEMTMLELYHDWRSFCSIKVRPCLAEKGLSWEGRFVDLIKLEHMTPQYLELHPNGVVTTLVHDGVPIYESMLINEYLDEVFQDVPLMPADPVERARARFWVKFEDDVLHPVIRPATFRRERTGCLSESIKTHSNTRSELLISRRRCSPLGPLTPESQFFAVRSLAPVHRIRVL
jgi:glutathione S-transferase